MDDQQSEFQFVQPVGTANSFSEVIEIAGQILHEWTLRWGNKPHGILARGTPDKSYSLDPGALRVPPGTTLGDLFEREYQRLKQFQVMSRPFLDHSSTTKWDLQFVMQQHGFATRLLDWSRNLAVALFFSLRGEPADQSGALWIMAARHLADLSGFQGGWMADPTAKDISGWETPPPSEMKDKESAERLVKEMNDRHPLVVQPPHLTHRLVVQQGLYTVHPFTLRPLEALASEDSQKFPEAPFLQMIEIPSVAKTSIRTELQLICGVTEYSLFPDLDGLAREFAEDERHFCLEIESAERDRD